MPDNPAGYPESGKKNHIRPNPTQKYLSRYGTYGHETLHFESESKFSRVGPDMIFLPDAGYPAGLSGMSCRILPDIRLFIAG